MTGEGGVTQGEAGQEQVPGGQEVCEERVGYGETAGLSVDRRMTHARPAHLGGAAERRWGDPGGAGGDSACALSAQTDGRACGPSLWGGGHSDVVASCS